MAIQKIQKAKINKLVTSLGGYYRAELAEICYGTASPENLRKISHWRSGKLVDTFEQRKIMIGAQKLIQKRASEMQKMLAR